VTSSTSPDEASLAICPACGYPTLGQRLCALCIPAAGAETDVAADAVHGAPDVTPAA